MFIYVLEILWHNQRNMLVASLAYISLSLRLSLDQTHLWQSGNDPVQGQLKEARYERAGSSRNVDLTTAL